MELEGGKTWRTKIFCTNYESDHLYASYMHGIEILASTYSSPELVEGMTAFLEKRRAEFGPFRV